MGGAVRVAGVTAVALGLACAGPPATTEAPGPRRLPILRSEYGAHPDHTEALELGAHLDELRLPLADGGGFELDAARGAGAVILAWIGGAEHEGLTAWLRSLDRGIDALDARGATLVFVRPLPAEAALRWAIDLALQTAVAGDPEGELAARLDAIAEPERPALDFAVVIVDRGGQVVYRKLGGRRPELGELLSVLDGDGETLRCCPGACVGDPCVGP